MKKLPNHCFSQNQIKSVHEQERFLYEHFAKLDFLDKSIKNKALDK